ncbi:MAG TPA: hypothetical protein VFL59_12195 [Candidatus Nanopelagicales bacterium]|nr:hypothetical protein [Candidatus Nanopelagicales bacterium]
MSRLLGSNMKRILLVIAAAIALVIGSSAPVSAATSPPSYTCTGGDFATGNLVHIHSGTYASLTIAGACDVDPWATITIVGNLTVEAGAVFDAQTVPSTITVGHNVIAGTGALLGLGCQPDQPHKAGHECGAMFDPDDAGGPEADDPDVPCVPELENPFGCASSVITIRGNVTATDANTVLLNGIMVHGNVTLSGGGGDIPWAIKNNTIGRNLTVSGVTAEWFGALFNQVGRNMTLTNITATDPEEVAAGGTPTVQIVRNVIAHNLTCHGIGPALAFGFYPGQVNTVGHKATGQCSHPVST